MTCGFECKNFLDISNQVDNNRLTPSFNLGMHRVNLKN
jgi:hypothetical protein